MKKNGHYRWYKIMLIMDDYGKESLMELKGINNSEKLSDEEKITMSKKRIDEYISERIKMIQELPKMDISELDNLMGWNA